MRFLVIFSLLLVPNLGLAAGFIPCGNPGEPQCNACHLVTMGQTILNWLIGFTVLIVGLVFAIGGLRMVMSAGNTNEVTAARSMFTNAIVGLIILLSAWLIVDTVLKVFLPSTSGVAELKGFGPWNRIQCVGALPPVTTTQPPGGVTPTTPTTPPPGGKLTDAEARDQLSAAGISVNKTQAQGTSLEGVNKQSIDRIIALKDECGCSLVVTGGTESTGGHQTGTISHGEGYKLDLRPNSQLNAHIMTFSPCGTRGGYCDSLGNEYVREFEGQTNDHWDVRIVDS